MRNTNRKMKKMNTKKEGEEYEDIGEE